MRACSDIDFLASYWEETKKISSKIKADLPLLATSNIPYKEEGVKPLMYFVKFSDLQGSWGVEEILKRVAGKSKTLDILADKIANMIERGRAKDVKPLLESICTGKIKTLSHPPGKSSVRDEAYCVGHGHFRWNFKAHTLSDLEISRLKKYFNL